METKTIEVTVEKSTQPAQKKKSITSCSSVILVFCLPILVVLGLGLGLGTYAFGLTLNEAYPSPPPPSAPAVPAVVTEVVLTGVHTLCLSRFTHLA